ncbi:MAG: hypothetical protein H0X33_13355 [Taibaiella sp.]|nr:hypothetical protein [Taibaiella sp.]
MASNGAAIASAWSKEGTSVIECFPDSVRDEFPVCICCDDPIFDSKGSKAAHASCTETIIEERDYFQDICKKSAGANVYFYTPAPSTRGGDIHNYEVYERTMSGDKQVAQYLKFEEAKRYCDRMNTDRNR